MTIYLANAFSLGMLANTFNLIMAVPVREVTARNYLSKAQFVSVVGHEATAQVISKRLGLPVQVNREAIKLEPDDVVVVFQLKTRLPEGKVLSEEEMENLPAEWWYIEILRMGNFRA